MAKWYKKLFKKPHKESQRVSALRALKKSDTERWSRADVMHTNWEERTIRLSKHINKNSNVVEFGAGSAILKDVLDKTITYQPVDIIKRQENYLVCDLNVNPLAIDLTHYDTVVFSGVLEYVYDIDLLFQELSRHITYVPLSYACSDICKQDRLFNGWLSDYSSSELEEIFKKHAFKIIKKYIWKDQNLYFLEHE